MKIALTCQNCRTLSAHAGRCRNFLVTDGVNWWPVALETGQVLRDSVGDEDWSLHPLDGIDVLMTAGAGTGLVQGLARRGIRTVISAQPQPADALAEWLAAGQRDPVDGGGESTGSGGRHCRF